MDRRWWMRVLVRILLFIAVLVGLVIWLDPPRVFDTIPK